MRRISGTSHRAVTKRTPLGHMAEGVLLVLAGRRSGRHNRQETLILLGRTNCSTPTNSTAQHTAHQSRHQLSPQLARTPHDYSPAPLPPPQIRCISCRYFPQKTGRK